MCVKGEEKRETPRILYMKVDQNISRILFIFRRLEGVTV